MHHKISLSIAALLIVAVGSAQSAPPAGEQNVSGWSLQDVASVSESGNVISTAAYKPIGWYKAVVPGTVLTSLVASGKYLEPLYGENNRSIPESLCRTSYWYRTTVPVSALTPRGYSHAFLTFYGINYAAEVWANGQKVGEVKGAFARGSFDLAPLIYDRSKNAVVTVAVSPASA